MASLGSSGDLVHPCDLAIDRAETVVMVVHLATTIYPWTSPATCSSFSKPRPRSDPCGRRNQIVAILPIPDWQPEIYIWLTSRLESRTSLDIGSNPADGILLLLRRGRVSSILHPLFSEWRPESYIGPLPNVEPWPFPDSGSDLANAILLLIPGGRLQFIPHLLGLVCHSKSCIRPSRNAKLWLSPASGRKETIVSVFSARGWHQTDGCSTPVLPPDHENGGVSLLSYFDLDNKRSNPHRSFGPQFSSDNAGDGPLLGSSPTRGYQHLERLSSGILIKRDLRIFVAGETFPESQYWEEAHATALEGYYVEPTKLGWRVAFPLLGTAFNLSSVWILQHGSNTDLGTRRLMTALPTPPQRKSTQTPTLQHSFPCPGSRVYVPWSSFPESSEPLWPDRDQLCVLAVYKKRVKSRWAVSFPALGNKSSRTHLLECTWINEFGKNSNPTGIIMTRELYRSRTGSPHIADTPDVDTADSTPTQKVTSSFHSPDIDAAPLFQNLGFPDALPSESFIGVASWNVNSFNDSHTEASFWCHLAKGAGITALLDTRAPKSRQPFLRLSWQNLVGAEGRVSFSASSTDRQSVGGQMHLVSSEWGRYVMSTWSDRSGLGILHETKIRRHGHIVRFLTVYWPVDHSDEDSDQLGAQLARFIHLEGSNLSKQEYILSNIASRARKPHHTFVVGGDFNSPLSDLTHLPVLSHLTPAALNCSTTRYSGTKATGTIDHILYAGQLLQAGCVDGSCWSTFSDHRIVWARLAVPGPNSIRISSSPKRRQDRSLRPDSRDLETFQQAMVDGMLQRESLSPLDRAEHICRSAAVLATRPAKQHRFHLWTPLTSGLLIWLQFLDSLQTTPVDKAAIRARNRILRIGLNGPEILLEIQRIPLILPLSTWLALPSTHGMGDYIVEQRRIILKQLHGRARRARQEKIWSAIGRLRSDPYRFYSSMGLPRLHPDLSTLQNGDTFMTDPEVIDSHLATYFHQQFQCNEEIRLDLWDQLQQSSSLSTLLPNNVPPQLQETILAAIRAPTSAARQKVANALSRDQVRPTLEEFIQILHKANKTSAGGPSGCTYRHISLLPPLVLNELYNALSQMWDSGSCARGWLGHKTLILIPKRAGTCTVQNLRPIVLIEVARKLWYKTIIKKVQNAVESAGILQANQLGFRGGRSCSDGLLSFINNIEAAEQTHRPLFCSSWDIVGAFNAPPRPLLVLALQRLGIPEGLAKELGQLDNGDIISIATPFRAATAKGSTLSTGKGCGQGDVVSPFLWTGFFDIILTAINSCSSCFYTTNSKDIAQVSQDTAFADDLLSFAANLAILQRKADIMSASSAIMRFLLAAHKFRCFAINGSGEIVVHDSTWSPTIVPLSVDGFIRYLGSTRNIDGSYTEEARLLLQATKETLSRISSKAHRPEHTAHYLNRALLPKLQYPASFATLSRPAITQMVRATAAAYKNALHVASSFPTAVLAAPTTLGGLGFLHPADALGDSKWRMLTRSLVSPCSASVHAVDAILARASRNCLGSFRKGFHSIREGGPPSWMSDLISLLSPTNSFLAQAHGLDHNALDEPIEQTSWAREFNLVFLGDIMERKGDQLLTISSLVLNAPTVQWSLKHLDLMPLFLRPGQIWATLRQGSFDSAYLFRGWEGSCALCTPLHASCAWSARRKTPTFNSGPLDLFVADWAQWTHHLIGQEHTTGWKFIHASEMIPQRRGTAPPPPRYTGPLALCSDGSHARTVELFDFLSDATSSAGIILPDARHSTYPQHSIHVRLPPTPSRSFGAEIAGMAIALASTVGSTSSDCRGGISAMSQHTSRIPLLSLVTGNSHRLQWIRSHPERRLPLTKWTTNDYDIHFADVVAGGGPAYTGPRLHWSDFTSSLLTQFGRWTIANQDGILLQPPLILKQQADLMAYIGDKTKAHKTNWSYNGFTHFMRSCQGTLAQKAAWAKLYLGKFEPDRQFRQNTRPPCSCGCSNSLQAWVTVCKKPEVIPLQRALRSQISQESTIPSVLRRITLALLDSPHAEALLRGHWSPAIKEKYTLGIHTQAILGAAPGPSLICEWQKGFITQRSILSNGALTLYSAAHAPSSSNSQPIRRQLKLTGVTARSRALGLERALAATSLKHKASAATPLSPQTNLITSWLNRKHGVT